MVKFTLKNNQPELIIVDCRVAYAPRNDNFKKELIEKEKI